MRQGGKGVISVTANIAPRAMTDFCTACLNDDWAQATLLDEQLQILHRALSVSSNPIPVKWALYAMNKIPLGVRLPLLPLAAEYHDELRTALREAAIL
jgi:4-hydroxy-tetrahydrodipicolinate synthase